MPVMVHKQQHSLLCIFTAEAIDVPWGVPASFNASGLGSVMAVDHNTSRYRDVAAVVGDTVTIHWNHTAGGNYSLWQIPSGWRCPAYCVLIIAVIIKINYQNSGWDVFWLTGAVNTMF